MNSATPGGPMAPAPALRILAIQKNNIGDLVLITPFLAELRRRFPAARIDVLANSYNASVLDRNGDVDHVYVYMKRKHRPNDLALPRLYWQTSRLVLDLRHSRYDYAFLLNGRFSMERLTLARLIAPKHVVGFAESAAQARAIDTPLASDPIPEKHVVPRSLRLLNAAFPVESLTEVCPDCNPCRVFPDPAVRSRLLFDLFARGLAPGSPIVALQISARKQKQRWPLDKFARLARLIAKRIQAPLVVFWSPGNETVATHPGDDSRAEALLAMCSDLPMFGCRTAILPELIAGLSTSDVVVSSDGGAMHLAAACARSVVALYGNSDAEIWHPWCRFYRMACSRSGNVSDISVEEVFDHVEHFVGLKHLAGV
jgi:heptosyltransferase-3